MKKVPWINIGKKCKILGKKAKNLGCDVCTPISYENGNSDKFPDVKVSVEGREICLHTWELVEDSLKSFHSCVEICPGVKFFEWRGYENDSNTILFEKGDTRILVDSGHFHLLGSLLKSLDDEGILLDSIKAGLYTHCHPDHFDSADFLQQAGVKIGLSKKEEDYLRGEGGLLFRFFGADVPEVKNEIPLEKGKLKLGNIELSIFSTPGHSPGSVCIYWDEKKVLCAGDVVFPDGAFGRCDFPGGSYQILLDSFEIFDDLEIDYLLSGHGYAIIGKENVVKSIKESRNNLRAVIFSPW